MSQACLHRHQANTHRAPPRPPSLLPNRVPTTTAPPLSRVGAPDPPPRPCQTLPPPHVPRCNPCLLFTEAVTVRRRHDHRRTETPLDRVRLDSRRQRRQLRPQAARGVAGTQSGKHPRCGGERAGGHRKNRNGAPAAVPETRARRSDSRHISASAQDRCTPRAAAGLAAGHPHREERRTYQREREMGS